MAFVMTTTEPKMLNPTSLCASAERLLRQSAYSQLHRIKCELIDRVLFLRGQVTSFHLKQIAQQSVVRLEGIDRIYNFVEVVAERSDES